MKTSIAAVTYMLHKSQVNLVVIIFGGSIKYPRVHEVKKYFLRYFNDYFHNHRLKNFFLFFYTDTNIAFQRFPLQNEMLQ